VTGTGGHSRRGSRARETREEARGRRSDVADPEVVLAAAARLLESRPRSVAEVRRHLELAGYRPGLVEGAVERLVELGYLDDAEFATAWITSRDRAHPRGERALRSELLRKGVPRDVIDASIADRGLAATDDVGDADDRAAAALLARRRAALERIADPRQRRQRAYAVLARGGFDPETASRAADRFARGADSD